MGPSYQTGHPRRTKQQRHQAWMPSQMAKSIIVCNHYHLSLRRHPCKPPQSTYVYTLVDTMARFHNELVDGCSCSRRIWNMVVEHYFLDVGTDESLYYHCLVPRCHKSFTCHQDMFRHLKACLEGCDHYSNGILNCLVCNGAETHQIHPYRKCGWCKVKRSIENLRSSLSFSSHRRSGSQEGLRCGACSPPLPLGPSSPHSAGSEGTSSTMAPAKLSLPEKAYGNMMNSPIELGNTGLVELMDSPPVYELGSTHITKLEDSVRNSIDSHIGSNIYDDLLTQNPDSESTDFNCQPSTADRRLSQCQPSTLVSSPSTYPYWSPASVSSASSDNNMVQNDTVSSVDFDGHEQVSIDGAGDRTKFPYWQANYGNESVKISSTLGNTSLCEERTPCVHQIWPLGSDLGSSNFESDLFASRTGTEVLTSISSGLSRHTNGAITIPYINTQFDAGDKAPLYELSPSSQTTTFPQTSDALSQDQAGGHQGTVSGLSCPDCSFQPSGNPKNYIAYLRKHRRIHQNPQVVCAKCGKSYTRQDNLTVHTNKIHGYTNKRRRETKESYGEQTLQRKRTSPVRTRAQRSGANP